jgi:hypothetical protein
MNTDETPTSLFRSSKEKFVLSQARLHREHIELTLLSLHGSLEDGLRGYVLLHGHAVARDDWPSLLQVLRSDETHPLSREEADRLQRIYRMWVRIVRGEAVTLAAETMRSYQEFAARLLLRYGVLVVAPETDPEASLVNQLKGPNATTSTWAQRIRVPQAAIVLLVLVLVAGVLVMAVLNGPAALQAIIGIDAPVHTASGSATALPNNVLAPGRQAFVRRDLDSDMALYTQPGDTADSSIRLYVGPGTAVRVIDGPVAVQGTEWWQVRALNQTGWCRADMLEVR